MALPVLQKPWTITHRVLPLGGGTAASGRTSASAFWAALFAALEACGWEQVRYGPGSNLESQIENGKWSLHSMPFGGQLLIACNHMYLGTAKVTASPGGLFAGGDDDTPPTASDVVDWGQWSLPNAASPYNQTFDAVLHQWLAPDGALRLFWGFNGALSAGLMFDPVARPSPGWTTPCQIIVADVATTVFNRANMATSTSTRHCLLLNGKWYRCGFTDLAQGASTPSMDMRAPNAISGKWPLLPLGIFQRYSTPDSAALGGYHGYVQDAWYGCEPGLPSGTTYPADGTRQFVQIGALVLPWDGSALTGMAESAAVDGEVVGEMVPSTWGPPPPPPDATKPTVRIISPDLSDPEVKLGSHEPIVIEVEDPLGRESIRRALLMLEYDTSKTLEVAHTGDRFGAHFAAGSTREVIATGWRYSLLRDTRWPGVPTFTPFILDTTGNEIA